jgi:hypothetical protein
MNRLQILLSLCCALVVSLIAAPSVAADVPTGGLLVTTSDHLDPGSSFTVLGSGIDPGTTVTFRLDSESRTLPLGDAVVAQDGTLSATFDLAAEFPLGDAWLRGRTTTGIDLELYVHVGPRAMTPGQSPVAAAAAGPLDERSVGLAVLALGLVVLAAASAWSLRERRQTTSSPGRPSEPSPPDSG